MCIRDSLSDRFEEEAQERIREGLSADIAYNDPDEHEFFVPERARWAGVNTPARRAVSHSRIASRIGPSSALPRMVEAKAVSAASRPVAMRTSDVRGARRVGSRMETQPRPRPSARRRTLSVSQLVRGGAIRRRASPAIAVKRPGSRAASSGASGRSLRSVSSASEPKR